MFFSELQLNRISTIGTTAVAGNLPDKSKPYFLMNNQMEHAFKKK